MPARRIESKTSRTAEMTCLSRAASAREQNPLYKSDDWVAEQLLPRKIQALFGVSAARRFLVRTIAPEGAYEWIIARTKYIDAIWRQACAEGIEQAVIFGAGFDTRGIRFSVELKGARVFELDAPATQTAKLGQYRKRGIEVPANLIFVPLNFDREASAEKLRAAGCRRGAKTLAMLEGVTQYLQPEAVRATLAVISGEAGPGSLLVFDYALTEALRPKSGAYGRDKMLKGVAKYGESWQFSLEEAEVEPLLAGFGFRIMDHRSPRDLEETYFRDGRGRLQGRVNGTQGLVTAIKAG